MNLEGKLRSALGRYRFRKELRKNQVVHDTVGFEEAKKIGILYNATDEADYEVIKEYVKKLRSEHKKDVLAMGFVDRKKMPASQFPQYGLDFFCKKDLDFRMIPKDPIVHNFIQEPFDILVNLNAERCFPLQYIAALSQARFRVGRYDRRTVDCYDMMINLKGDPGIRTMIDEIETFLRILK
ncbi:MAG: DUF6913 domain-containing protein [Bacteroidota bacterium]